MHSIIFKIEGNPDVKVLASKGENLLDIMQKNGIVIDAPCSGGGTCGKCRIRVTSGDVDMTHSPRLPKADYHDSWRLACQSRVIGDAVIWVPASASAFRKPGSWSCRRAWAVSRRPCATAARP